MIVDQMVQEISGDEVCSIDCVKTFGASRLFAPSVLDSTVDVISFHSSMFWKSFCTWLFSDQFQCFQLSGEINRHEEGQNRQLSYTGNRNELTTRIILFNVLSLKLVLMLA